MAGVGGRTIEEAQENLSLEEVTAWWDYRLLRGPMNPMLRMDRIGALSAAVQTGKPMSSFMPWSRDPQGESGTIGESDFEKARALAMVNSDGHTSRKVASRPSSVLKSGQSTISRTVPAYPNKQRKTPLTLEQRRERLRKHGK